MTTGETRRESAAQARRRTAGARAIRKDAAKARQNVCFVCGETQDLCRCKQRFDYSTVENGEYKRRPGFTGDADIALDDKGRAVTPQIILSPDRNGYGGCHLYIFEGINGEPAVFVEVEPGADKGRLKTSVKAAWRIRNALARVQRHRMGCWPGFDVPPFTRWESGEQTFDHPTRDFLMQLKREGHDEADLAAALCVMVGQLLADHHTVCGLSKSKAAEGARVQVYNTLVELGYDHDRALQFIDDARRDPQIIEANITAKRLKPILRTR